MSHRSQARAAVAAHLAAAVEAGAIPGAAWVVARGREGVDAGVTGCAARVPRRRRLRRGAIYDLASLTKPLATGALAVRLARTGCLTLEEPLPVHLPELAGTSLAPATLLDLLLHRSGLPAWRPLFLHRGDAGDVVRRLGRTPLAAEPGARVLYSDLGYLLAGVLLARAGGAPLDDLYTQHILAPCEPPAREPCFRPPPAWRSRLAPGEVGDEIHRELASCHEAAVQAWPGWRAGVHLGEVHDLNAAALGGVAGHAGLFGSAAGVAALAAEFLPGSRLFTPAERAVFRYSRTSGQEEDRAVGFRVAARTWSLVPAACSPDSFGHTGFTGTLVLIDPATAGVFVLLTNRLHPHPPAAGMAGLRRGFLARAAALLERTAGEAGKGPGDGRGGGRSALQ